MNNESRGFTYFSDILNIPNTSDRVILKWQKRGVFRDWFICRSSFTSALSSTRSYFCLDIQRESGFTYNRDMVSHTWTGLLCCSYKIDQDNSVSIARLLDFRKSVTHNASRWRNYVHSSSMKSTRSNSGTVTHLLIDNANYAKTKRSRMSGKNNKFPDNQIENKNFSKCLRQFSVSKMSAKK